jgi:hypothetical protein
MGSGHRARIECECQKPDREGGQRYKKVATG